MMAFKLFRSAVFGGFLLFSSASRAQMLDCNVFLQASHLEVGVCPTGAFGSSVMAPSGYHGNSDGGLYRPCGGTGGVGNLGFIADPSADGWTVGSPPFFGDYFLPGMPYEGWSIQVDTAGRRDAWNVSGFTGPLTGSNIAYSAGSVVSTIWQGTTDSIQISQETTLDTSMLYITVKVTLTNFGHLPQNEIYYYRAVDPDNDQMQVGGSFVTNNQIEHQALDTTVVSATGLTHTAAYLALGTIDTNAECLINSTLWSPPPTTTLATLYNHTAGPYYTYSGTLMGDLGIALIFRIAHLATVDSVSDSTHRYTPLHAVNSSSFSYFYAFSPAARDSAIAYLNRKYTAPPALGLHEVADATVKVYPNPATNVINVTGLKLNDQVIMYDMMGRPTELSANVGNEGVNSFSTSSLPAGHYLMEVRDANGNVRSRVRVQKQ